MGNNYILFLVLFLIILVESFVLILGFFGIRRRIKSLTDEVQRLSNEMQQLISEVPCLVKDLKDGVNHVEDKARQLITEVENLKLSQAKLRDRLNESDRKNEEDRRALKMLMISDLGNDISGLEKKGTLDEKLRVLLGRVKENISKAENI